MNKTLGYHVEYRTRMTEYEQLQDVLNQQVKEGWNLVGVYPAAPFTDRDGEVCDYYMSVWQRVALIAEATPCPTP